MDFWIKVYTQYSASQGVIHDAKYPEVVYEILDFGEGGSRSESVRLSKARWKDVLLSVHAKQRTPEKLTPTELHVYQLFQGIEEEDKFLAAAQKKRIRYQLGQKGPFERALAQSGRYLVYMEGIFREHGVPVEWTRIPFVESGFDYRARSKVGASGIWQFIPSTAHLYMKMNAELDERNDPIAATHAAARLLQMNFESLESWPLSVTAYNHGRKGMMRATREVGSRDPEQVLSRYRSQNFGFASRNFLMEVLAALEVDRHSERYFPGLKREKPMNYFDVILRDFLPFSQLAKALKLSPALLKDFNPALTSAVYEDRLWIPAGYRFRLPQSSVRGGGVHNRDQFWRIYDKMDQRYKRSRQITEKYDR